MYAILTTNELNFPVNITKLTHDYTKDYFEILRLKDSELYKLEFSISLYSAFADNPLHIYVMSNKDFFKRFSETNTVHYIRRNKYMPRYIGDDELTRCKMIELQNRICSVEKIHTILSDIETWNFKDGVFYTYLQKGQ